MSRYQTEKLGKNCVIMCQDLIFLLYYVVCSHLHCNTYRELGLFYIKLWDSSDLKYVLIYVSQVSNRDMVFLPSIRHY